MADKVFGWDLPPGVTHKMINEAAGVEIEEDEIKPICVGCKKEPHELSEYIQLAEEESISPAQYVREGEGTYNKNNGHFLCTNCYISWGMPSSPIGWVAP